MAFFEIIYENLNKTLNRIIKTAKEKGHNGYTDSVELVLGLKYQPSREEKCFFASNSTSMVCILGDEAHCAEAAINNVPYLSLEDLKKINTKISLITLTDKYIIFLASESVIQQIPAQVTAALEWAEKLPTLLTHDAPVIEQSMEAKSSFIQKQRVRFVTTDVGHIDMSLDQIVGYIRKHLNILVNIMLTSTWKNIHSVYIKTLVVPPHLLYHS